MIGSRILEDRTSAKAYLAGNNAAFNSKIANTLKKDYTRIEQLGIFEHKNQPTPHIFYYRAEKYRSEDKEEIEEYMVRQIHHFYCNN